MHFDLKISVRRWNRVTFLECLSEFGGLVVTVFAALKILTSAYHEFAKDRAMVAAATLYGQTGLQERVDANTSLVSEASVAKQTLEEYVRGRQEFKVSFCSKFFFTTVLSCCCCCLKRRFKAQVDKYRKF